MTPDDDIFADALEIPEAGRAAFLDQACAGDAVQRARVEALLRGLERMPGILESPATQQLAVTPDEKPSDTIGRYKLLEKIGVGGCGVVWMAEQTEPVRRRVALKVIKLGMDTKEVIARFEAERQALALMDHPNIAKIHDAGTTATGRPYFVMELVRGVPLTRYCDGAFLPTEARLRLFVQVCHAIQHAHQKGIIHRDIKPSNILVTVNDGVAVSKVIDFGIAKATQGQLTDKTLFTAFQQFIGTPAYMSPEQADLSSVDIDTRSDIYSLGVLLYELLAGQPPFDAKALASAGLDEIRRQIREVEPARPSTRVATLGEAERETLGRLRGLAPAQLSGALRGDLDWIVMRCLEKDRARRYKTANALARDVERHLAHEPVAARPPSTLYRAQKLFRRHKLAVTATAAVAASLVGGLVVSSALYVSERAARTRAVAAEKSEEKLRQQAEAARIAEARLASRTSLALAEKLLPEGRTSEGLAHLVRAARSDAANSAIGPRLISALAFRSYAEPIGELLPHPAPPRSASYSKDSRHCVTRDEDGHLRYWDLTSGRLLQDIVVGEMVDSGWFVSVAVSPDATLAAVGGFDGTATFWHIPTGRKVLGPIRLEQRMTAGRFSEDGRSIAVSGADGIMRILNVETGETQALLRHGTDVLHAAFSPDSTRVLTTSTDSWRIWRLPDGEPITPYLKTSPGGGYATEGTFSPDGKLVAIAFSGRNVQLFDALTGAAVGALMPHDGRARAPLFTGDGEKLVTASIAATARVWEVPTGKSLLPPLVDGSSVNPARLASDNRHLLTRSADGVARVWDLATGRLALEPVRIGDVRFIDLAPDGTEFLMGGRDGTVRRWRLAPGAAVPFRISRTPERKGMHRESGNAPVVSVIDRDRIQRLDLLAGRTLGPPRLFPVPIDRWIISSPDGRRLLVVISGETELWDLSGVKISRQRMGKVAGANTRPSFSADGKLLASVENAGLRVWNASTGALVAGPFAGVNRYALSPDSRQLVFNAGVDAQIWDFAKGRLDGEPLRAGRQILWLEFSPDSRLIAMGSEVAQLWDARTRQPIGPPLPHRNIVRVASFTRDGRRLLTTTPLETRVWEVATGASLTETMVGGTDIVDAVFSEDGTRIATASRTTDDVRLWDSISGQLLADPVRAGRVGRIGFSSADRILSRATGNGGFMAWPVPPQSGPNGVPDWLLRLATAMAGGEIDARAVFREQAFDAKAFDAIRRELAALPATAPYVEWGRWLLADRATRPIAPGFTITPAEAAKFAGPEVPDEPTTGEP